MPRVKLEEVKYIRYQRMVLLDVDANNAWVNLRELYLYIGKHKNDGRKLYASDKRDRYFHIYYDDERKASDRGNLKTRLTGWGEDLRNTCETRRTGRMVRD